MDNDIIPIDQLPEDDVIPVNQLPSGQTSQQANPFLSALQSAGKVVRAGMPSPNNLSGQIPGMNIMNAQDQMSEQIKEQGMKATNKSGFLASLVLDPRTYMGIGVGGAETPAVLAATAEGRSNVAGALVNSLIKPVDKAFRFHGNPGMVVAKEGLWDATLPGLKAKIGQRLGELDNQINKVKSGLEYADKKINLEDVLAPMKEQTKELSKMPLSNKESLNKIADHMEDFKNLTDIEKGGIDLKNASIEDAYKLKKAVNSITDWEKTAAGDNFVNAAAKKIYRNIDAKIDEAVPPLKEFNDRTRGLIDADKAVTRRLSAEQRRGLIGMPAMGAGMLGALVGHVPGAAVAMGGEMLSESPIFKTGLAKLLAEKYPALLKSI